MGTAAGAVIAALGAPAWAQDAGSRAQDQEFAPIVVTARLREESLQDVPLSITAFDEDAIERAEIADISTLSILTPGLTFNDPFGRLNPTASMRGMSNPGIGEEQMVGFFIDGAYISGRSSLNLVLTDLERIEVTRGPQGALYGRNTFAGAVNFVTRDAPDDFEAGLDLTIGTHDRYEIRGTVGGPLGDVAALRVGGVYRSWGGFYENDNPGGVDIGDQETIAGNATLSLEPTDRLSLRFRVMASHDEDANPTSFLVPANSEGGRFYTGELPERSPDGYRYGPDSEGFERDSLRAFGFLNYEISDEFSFDITTSFADEDIFYNYDADLLPVRFWVWEQETDRQDYSIDARVSHEAADGSRSAILGVSYYDFENTLLDNLHLPGFGQTPPNIESITATQSFSIYGSITQEIGDDIELTGELRYLQEESDFRSDLTDAAGVPLDLDESWDTWLPRFSLSYRFSPDILAYASAARGFKSGGFNSSQNIFADERSFDPESNWTYEVGLKTTLFDGQINANVAAFYVDWTNQQVSSASLAGNTANTYVTNAAETSIRGLEIDIIARLGDGFSLQAGYAFADSEFETFFDPALIALPSYAPDGDVSGNTLPRQSRHQANGVFEYQGGAMGDWDWYGRVEALYQSSQYSTSANLAETGDQTKVNLRIGLQNERYELSAWVRNVFNDRTPAVGIRFVDSTNRFGNGFFARAWQITPADGRTAGVTLRLRLGR
ncbi:MAG: TonB-dependent receptor [Parasphingopyxis sp.]